MRKKIKQFFRICGARSKIVVRRIFNEEKGQSLVEYALIILLIALVVIGSLTTFGGAVLNLYTAITAGPGGV